jgi:tryptophan synthase alpha chain
MNTIASVFNNSGRKALIPYITIGYPNVDATLNVVPLLAGSGCDIVELGIPFSDPLADGATIQNSSFHALNNGVTPEICLDVARKLSAVVNVPLVFMGYYNPIAFFGLEKFCEACGQSGVTGLIIPDLPPDEGTQLETIANSHGIDLIYLLAPTSTEERIKLVAERSSGYIYLVSVTGVTGARNDVSADLASFISRVRKVTDKPLCVGFGVSTPEQAKQISRLADGVIVGSRIIQLMENDASLASVGDFASGLRAAIDEADNA